MYLNAVSAQLLTVYLWLRESPATYSKTVAGVVATVLEGLWGFIKFEATLFKLA